MPIARRAEVVRVGEHDDADPGGSSEEFINSAAYRELSAFERDRTSRRLLPPPTKRGRRRELRGRRRAERRRRTRSWLHRSRPWLLFGALTGIVALAQLPGGGVDPGRTWTGASPLTLQVGTADVPRPTRAPSREPLGQPASYPDVPQGYEFMNLQRDGSPVAYDPCRPIPHVVNLRTAPPGGEELLREAVARISAVTGLQFVSEGVTDEPPTDARAPFQPGRYGDRWAPVLIAWSDPGELPSLFGYVGRRAAPRSPRQRCARMST